MSRSKPFAARLAWVIISIRRREATRGESRLRVEISGGHWTAAVCVPGVGWIVDDSRYESAELAIEAAEASLFSAMR